MTQVNPFLYRKNTIEFFQSEGVAIQAYRTLFAGQGKKALSEPAVVSIAVSTHAMARLLEISG